MIARVVGWLLLLSASAHADSPLVKARPYYSRTPAGYSAAHAAPLLLFLQPYYPGDGRHAMEGFQLPAIADEKGLLLAAPDGTRQATSDRPMRFWNATDACCDFGATQVDDVAYLDAVVADMRARYNVDPKRIFVVGYSNGGFMTHRLLCERPGLFAAGASLAGAAWKDSARCRPNTAAALLEVHGDSDKLVPYNGGAFPGKAELPSSAEGVADWAKKIGCRGAAAALPPRDLVPDLPGAETAVSRYSCPAGAAELWTVHGGEHRGLGPTIRAAVEFLLSHTK